MNRISSPLVFLSEEIPQPESEDSITGSQNCFEDWNIVANACNPFFGVDLEGAVLTQAKKAFTCFHYILDACCIDAANVCSVGDTPHQS